MKILTILGARPQFIKAATVSRAIAEKNTRNRRDHCIINGEIYLIRTKKELILCVA